MDFAVVHEMRLRHARNSPRAALRTYGQQRRERIDAKCAEMGMAVPAPRFGAAAGGAWDRHRHTILTFLAGWEQQFLSTKIIAGYCGIGYATAKDLLRAMAADGLVVAQCRANGQKWYRSAQIQEQSA